MKIAINTRLLRNNKMDGIGWFTYNTVSRIVKNNPNIEFHFFFDSAIDKKFLFSDNVIPHKIFPPAKHALLNIAWSEWGVKKKLTKINPDLYFSPDGMICLGWKGVQYAVIHDINFAHHPEYLNAFNRRYYNKYFPRFAERACRISTVSEYSKKDIVATYNISPSKIDVVYCGINASFLPISSDKIKATKIKYSKGEDYFLFVGTISPRKNILGVLKSFEIFKKNSRFKTKLIIVGGAMYKVNEIQKFKSEMMFSDDVILTGSLEDSELNDIYNSALGLIFIPFFEGFGIPLLEAMQSNIPIIASNVTSIPEVAGDAALLVDPNNFEEIALAMQRIILDTELKLALIQKGQAQKNLFSWDKTCKLLWNSIEKCL